MAPHSSAFIPGVNSPEPRPKPSAPAACQAGITWGEMPPTASTGTWRGSTAFSAFITTGEPASAGKNFSTSAPARIAAKASLGVKNPGPEIIPAALVAAITSGSVAGETTSRPPAAATRSTSSVVSTVPAPTSTVFPASRAASADSRAIDS